MHSAQRSNQLRRPLGRALYWDHRRRSLEETSRRLCLKATLIGINPAVLEQILASSLDFYGKRDHCLRSLSTSSFVQGVSPPNCADAASTYNTIHYLTAGRQCPFATPGPRTCSTAPLLSTPSPSSHPTVGAAQSLPRSVRILRRRLASTLTYGQLSENHPEEPNVGIMLGVPGGVQAVGKRLVRCIELRQGWEMSLSMLCSLGGSGV